MANLHKVSFILLIIGGLNYLLEVMGSGINDFVPDGVSQVIYILIGLAAVNEIVAHKALCKQCAKGGV